MRAPIETEPTMFLIRTAFWISLVVLLLPSDERRQAELYQRVSSAAEWTFTFCDRNGPTCTRGGELWQVFKQKAEFGARIAGDLLQQGLRRGPEPVAVPPAEPRHEPVVAPVLAAAGRTAAPARDGSAGPWPASARATAEPQRRPPPTTPASR